MRITNLPARAALALVCLSSSGCIVTTQQHKELQVEVDELKKKVADRDAQLAETLERAETQSAELEKILRSNQATLGVRVEELELEVAGVRGTAEDGLNESAAITQNLEEMRGDLDGRLSKLETKLNEATNIPEGRAALLKEAEAQLKKKNYGYARRLFRTYLSRYDDPAKAPEIRFNIGLTLYQERDYRAALGEFYWIVQNAPESTQIHDALYYSGLAFAKLGQCSKAIPYFEALTSEGSKAPQRYQSQAKKQIETLSKDDGRICNDK